MHFSARINLQHDLGRGQLWLFPAPWAWGMLAGLAAIILAWFAISPLQLVVDEALTGTLMAGALLFALGLLNVARASSRLGALLLALSFFMIMGVLGRALNYLAVSLGYPYQDALFARANDLLGFDWQAHVLWLNEHPSLVKLLDFAYSSYTWLIPLTIVGLALWGRQARLREFLLLFSLTGFLCVGIGAFVPALGAYGYYGFSVAGLENIPAYVTAYLSDMEAVRAGTQTEFIVSEATGLTTFPSFHTVMALLFAWAWRGTWLQWPMAALSALTIAATPMMGAHYLIDLVGGATVFWLTLKALDGMGATDCATGKTKRSTRRWLALWPDIAKATK